MIVNIYCLSSIMDFGLAGLYDCVLRLGFNERLGQL